MSANEENTMKIYLNKNFIPDSGEKKKKNEENWWNWEYLLSDFVDLIQFWARRWANMWFEKLKTAANWKSKNLNKINFFIMKIWNERRSSKQIECNLAWCIKIWKCFALGIISPHFFYVYASANYLCFEHEHSKLFLFRFSFWSRTSSPSWSSHSENSLSFSPEHEFFNCFNRSENSKQTTANN